MSTMAALAASKLETCARLTIRNKPTKMTTLKSLLNTSSLDVDSQDVYIANLADGFVTVASGALGSVDITTSGQFSIAGNVLL